LSTSPKAEWKRVKIKCVRAKIKCIVSGRRRKKIGKGKYFYTKCVRIIGGDGACKATEIAFRVVRAY